MTALKQKDKGYFKALTGVRALAAFMVYIHHFNPFQPKYFGVIVYDFTREFHVGVTLFFVLSGFLIAYHYSDLSNFSFKKYMINRIARIYPMYFILTTVTFIFYFIVESQYNIRFVSLYMLNISFLRGFFTNFKFTGIAQGWSLTVEETFYIMAPLFFLLVKQSIKFLLILPVFLMSVGIGLVAVFSKTDFYGFFSTYDFMFNYTFFGRCFEFFTGIILAIIYKQKIFKPAFSNFTYLGIAGIFLSILLISSFKGNYDFGIRHPIGKLTNTVILPLFGISFFFYGLLTEKTLFSKILGSDLFVLLGKSSYIFYLIHMGVFVTLINQVTTNYFVVFIMLNIISIVLFKYIEEPVNLSIRKRYIKQP